MLKIVKLHIGLYRYLKQELNKKRNLKELILFFKNILLAYIKELLKLYKDLFLILDPEYRKQKKQFEKYNQLKIDLQRALKMLQYMDTKMEKAGLNRQRRRQFWRDFYSKGQFRKEIFNELLKEVK